MIPNRICLFVIFVIQFQSKIFAGVQSVGNGGGYGEMQAYYSEQLLPDLLEKIIAKGTLTAQQSENARLLRVKLSNVSQLSISTDCTGQGILTINNRLVLESCALYQKDIFGKIQKIDFKEIVRLVLRFYAKLSKIDDITELEKKMLLSLQISDSKSYFIYSLDLLFHLDKFNYSESQSFIWSLENSKATYSLNTLFNQAIGCQEKTFLQQVKDIESTSIVNKFLITGRLNWNCNSNFNSGLFYLILNEDKSPSELKIISD